jgi:hypothetical protein
MENGFAFLYQVDDTGTVILHSVLSLLTGTFLESTQVSEDTHFGNRFCLHCLNQTVTKQ